MSSAAGTRMLTVGLEVHLQLSTTTKMFCGCPVAFGGAPNTRICEICTGQPGSLPSPNAAAIRSGVRLALAVGAEIHTLTRFDRKNYFYADLPKGYQITQYAAPYATGGGVPLPADGQVAVLERIHFEEDTGMSRHVEADGDTSLVDLNRAGVPLLEIVTTPCFSDAEDATSYLRELRRLARTLAISDGDMEKGSLRCDVNISVSATDTPGTRTEVKNLNSFRQVRDAIHFETARQCTLLDAGDSVTLETLLWDDTAGETRPMRSKEEAHDYRYFPEPDLPPLQIPAGWLEEERAAMPPLPWERRTDWADGWGLDADTVAALLEDPSVAALLEDAVAAGADPADAARWLKGEGLAILGRADGALATSGLDASRLCDVVKAVDAGDVSEAAGRKALAHACENDMDIAAAVDVLGLAQVSGDDELRPVCEKVIAALPAAADDVRAGKEKAMSALIGGVMRETRGAADHAEATRILRELIGV